MDKYSGVGKISGCRRNAAALLTEDRQRGGDEMAVSKKTMKWIPWILILPVVLIRGFTTIYPIFVTIKNSFF